MNKIILPILLLAASSAVAGLDDEYLNEPEPLSRFENAGGSSDTGYKSSFGKRYEYDMNSTADQMRYEQDTGAQLRDDVYKDINPYREMEEDLGQKGGGILP
ncbi:MAG: hypothetical protein WCZ10_12695 [Desulfobulbaceae bacterium]